MNRTDSLGCFLLLVRHCNDFDFAQNTLGQILDRYAGACGLACKVFRIHSVECRKVCDIRQEAGGLDDIFKTHARCGQNTLDVFTGLLCLFFDVSAYHNTGLGTQRNLTGSKQEAVCFDCLSYMLASSLELSLLLSRV